MDGVERPGQQRDDGPHTDWIGAAEPGERPQLLALAERLERERPVPAAGFRGALRRRLLAADLPARRLSPGWARALIGLCGGSGTAALAVAALGLLGAGPFAA